MIYEFIKKDRLNIGLFKMVEDRRLSWPVRNKRVCGLSLSSLTTFSAKSSHSARVSLYRIIASQKQVIDLTTLSSIFVFVTSAFPRLTRSAYAKSSRTFLQSFYGLKWTFELFFNGGDADFVWIIAIFLSLSEKSEMSVLCPQNVRKMSVKF